MVSSVCRSWHCLGTKVNLGSANSQPTWFYCSAHTDTICSMRTVWSACAQAQTPDKWRTWDLHWWKHTAISCWGRSRHDLSSGTAFLLGWDTSGGTALFKAHCKCWWGGAGRARVPCTSATLQGSMCPSPPPEPWLVLFWDCNSPGDAAHTPNTAPVHRHTWHSHTWKAAWETDPN